MTTIIMATAEAITEAITTMITSHSKKPEAKKKPVKKVATKKIPKTSRDRALKGMQRLRRLEEANDEGYCKCISCGRVLNWHDMQGGHYIPRGNRATDIEKDNIWPQCMYCNCTLEGNYVMYRRNLIEKIGIERVERLENMAMARQGSEEALAKLTPEDRILAMMKKSNAYYYEKAQEIDKRLKELEGKN